MNRRTFLQSSFATGALASLPISTFSEALPPMHAIDKVGLQLYTVREAMKTDVPGTLSKVAAIGYKEVEFAGYQGKSPKELRAMIDQDGLTAPSSHISPEQVKAHLDEALEAAHIMGHEYLVCPWIDEKERNGDGYKRLAEVFNKAGETCKKAGVQFAYHNHNFEFFASPELGGQLPYDFLLASTDAKNVKMELDLCWITVSGYDPVAYFQKYPGRFPLVHVKDIATVPAASASKAGPLPMEDIERTMTPVGSGAIDWKRIFAHAKEGGVKHYFVENDMPKPTPFENITASYKYLSTLQA